MENNIYHLSTGVKNITVVGLPEGAKDVSVEPFNAYHEEDLVLSWYVGDEEQWSNLSPGEEYTLKGTLNEMSQEQAAEIVSVYDVVDGKFRFTNYNNNPPVFNRFSFATALESLRSLLESHGLLNKYPNVAILEKLQ